MTDLPQAFALKELIRRAGVHMLIEGQARRVEWEAHSIFLKSPVFVFDRVPDNHKELPELMKLPFPSVLYQFEDVDGKLWFILAFDEEDNAINFCSYTLHKTKGLRAFPIQAVLDQVERQLSFDQVFPEGMFPDVDRLTHSERRNLANLLCSYGARCIIQGNAVSSSSHVVPASKRSVLSLIHI